MAGSWVTLSTRIERLESSTVSSSELALLRQEIGSLSKQMEDLEDFTSEPRFTAKDNELQIAPLRTEVIAQRAEMTERGRWMDRKDDELEELRLSVSKLESRLD